MANLSRTRDCGECTECCRGWLDDLVHGYSMFPGKPCQFVSDKGCTIYEDRPAVPCKNYQCEWLRDDGLTYPAWMRPDLSKVIVTVRNWGENGEHSFLEFRECGQKIDSEILNWIYMFVSSNNIPARIQVNRGWNMFGPPEFRDAFSNAI